MSDKQTSQSNGSQMRITTEDRKIIKGLFKDNDPALKVLRKIFLPEIDPQAPLGQVIDLWMTVKIDDMSPEEAVINLKARNLLIQHVEQMLIQLQIISKQEETTPEEAKAKVRADSSK